MLISYYGYPVSDDDRACQVSLVTPVNWVTFNIYGCPHFKQVSRCPKALHVHVLGVTL